MVSFNVGAKLMRWSRPLLIKVGAKSTRQHDGCKIYYNKRWLQVDMPRSRPLLINVYVNIQMTMVWLGRCHLSFAVANCVLNLRFAAALDCWRGPQYDGKCCFYFNYFFHTTPTNQDLREKAVYFPSWAAPSTEFSF